MTRFYNLVTRRMGLKSLSWGITCIVLATAITNSTAQCDQRYMACNDFVQVSLDRNCMVIITPDMVLENPVANDAEYKVTVFDGRLPIGDTITEKYVNRTLEVSVRCLSSGVSCWGYLGIEDKLPPVITLFPPMVMLNCNTPSDLLTITDSTGNVFGLLDSFKIDNGGCMKIDSLDFMQSVEEGLGACGQNGVIRRITRTYKVTDKAGNMATANQVIEIKKAELKDVTYPKDTVISCIDLPAEGFTPDKFGRPGALSCDIFKSTYTDTRFPLCGGSFKILRSWIVVDWCDNRDTTVRQVLESLDTMPPVWNLAFMNFEPGSTDAGKQNCIGSITLPFERYGAATDLCYALQPKDYKVTYRLGDSTQADGFQKLIRKDVVINPINYDATISNLPLGIHQVIITATDACGNSSSATRQIRIEDRTPPNAICERITTAVLDNMGISEMMAFSLDDHSFDNCGIKKFAVKRLNSTCVGFENELSFGPSVHFCCADIPNNPIKVVLRVYDINDQFSECIVDVEVQDKRPVVLTCRPDTIVNCNYNFNNLQFLRRPTVQSDLCELGDPVLTIPAFTLDECGNGMFFVTWTISDFSGVRDSCKQKITVRNISPPSVTIPGSITIDGCDAALAHPAFINSEPNISNKDCELTASSHQDEINTTPNTGCIRITRTWTVIDWCTYIPSQPSTALRTGIQTITLRDNTAPVILDCPVSRTFIDSDENCSEFITLSIKASDNCTQNEKLKYNFSIDLNNDGVGALLTGTTSSITEVFGIGSHKITWTVTDQCGNVSNPCSYIFTISNPFNPAFVGTQNIPLTIPATLSINNLRASVTENCADTLIFSFGSSQQVNSVNYDCADVPNGVSANKTQKLYVKDGLGNQREFSLNVQLTDNSNVCPDVNGVASAVIRGIISDENNVKVPQVAVRLIDATTSTSRVVTTDINGAYQFDNLTPGRTYSVEPVLTGNDALGVSTIDMVQIQRHIIGLSPFTSPYKLIAADVNNNKSISASDLVLLQKLILGLNTSMSSNKPWRFVNNKHVFNEENQFDFPETFTISSIKEGITESTFTGVKVGDVNGNAFPALLSLTSDPRSVKTMKYTIGKVSDDLYKVEFSMDKSMNVTGFQLGIESASWELVDRENGALELRNDNLAVTDEHIRLSWNNPYGQKVGEEALFTFLIKGNAISQLDIERTFHAEIYDDELNIYQLALQKIENNTERRFEVFQNQPNPFAQKTIISFLLPERDRAELKVFDITGRVLLSKSGVFDRGINKFQIEQNELSSNGILYYTVETSTDIKGHKMILLQ